MVPYQDKTLAEYAANPELWTSEVPRPVVSYAFRCISVRASPYDPAHFLYHPTLATLCPVLRLGMGLCQPPWSEEELGELSRVIFGHELSILVCSYCIILLHDPTLLGTDAARYCMLLRCFVLTQ